MFWCDDDEYHYQHLPPVLGGHQWRIQGGARASTLRNFLSISRSFSEILVKLYAGAPHCRVGAPSYWNPGFAPGHLCSAALALDHLPSVVIGFSPSQMYFVESDWQVCGTHYNVSLSNSFKLLWEAFGPVRVRGRRLVWQIFLAVPSEFPVLPPQPLELVLHWFVRVYSFRTRGMWLETREPEVDTPAPSSDTPDWRPEPEVDTPAPSSGHSWLETGTGSRHASAL